MKKIILCLGILLSFTCLKIEAKDTTSDYDEEIQMFSDFYESPSTYSFQNDNAPVFQVETTDKYFSFIVKTEFESTCRFDQCGVAMYLNSDNWFKASIEYENEKIQRLGSVVTNHGYSDWATTDISSDIKSMWYRFSRRDSDYCIECSEDGINFRQMRIFHMWEGAEKITYGIYACSPTEGSYKATFSNMQITECKWESDADWRN